jgi:phosphatidylcholine synthase
LYRGHARDTVQHRVGTRRRAALPGPWSAHGSAGTSDARAASVALMPARTPGRVAAAWLAHAYTSVGLVLAALAAVALVGGGDTGLRRALLLLWFATAVDATDGILARRARVREVLPNVDGRRLDDIIDFLTYTSLPLLLIWRMDALPGATALLLLAPLLASAYGFSQVGAKTQDGYFLGFPSYWNVIALYTFLLRPPLILLACTLILMVVLTFVPSRYLYPSMPGVLNRAAAALGAVWAAVILLVLLDVPSDPQRMAVLSLTYPAFYLLASWSLGLSRPGHRGP